MTTSDHDYPDDNVDVDVDVSSLTTLVPSVEPSVVFGSLAARSVPTLCDECAIDIVDGVHAGYRIVFPPPANATGGLLRIVERAGRTSDYRVRVPFAWPDPDPAIPNPRSDDVREAFHGVATFGWHLRRPSQSDRAAAAVLVDRAVHTVVWQRSEQATEAALANAAHLQLALENSRRIGAAIGIVMSARRVTADDAFELLRRASQVSQRKLRDVALDVVETGWLDPALETRT